MAGPPRGVLTTPVAPGSLKVLQSQFANPLAYKRKPEPDLLFLFVCVGFTREAISELAVRGLWVGGSSYEVV